MNLWGLLAYFIIQCRKYYDPLCYITYLVGDGERVDLAHGVSSVRTKLLKILPTLLPLAITFPFQVVHVLTIYNTLKHSIVS